MIMGQEVGDPRRRSYRRTRTRLQKPKPHGQHLQLDNNNIWLGPSLQENYQPFPQTHPTHPWHPQHPQVQEPPPTLQHPQPPTVIVPAPTQATGIGPPPPPVPTRSNKDEDRVGNSNCSKEEVRDKPRDCVSCGVCMVMV